MYSGTVYFLNMLAAVPVQYKEGVLEARPQRGVRRETYSAVVVPPMFIRDRFFQSLEREEPRAPAAKVDRKPKEEMRWGPAR